MRLTNHFSVLTVWKWIMTGSVALMVFNKLCPELPLMLSKLFPVCVRPLSFFLAGNRIRRLISKKDVIQLSRISMYCQNYGYGLRHSRPTGETTHFICVFNKLGEIR